ncbi:MAG: desulfoferrodoxin family protein [Bacteroidales bacterium]|jgi:desulfoferrodoxin (superoxide reductase-like protein)|nr:desulfoferrodoxin family protein [Bacteroidales bacterium]
MKRKFTITGIITLFAFILFSFNGYANKTSVKVIAPGKAQKGTEITIKIEVSHSGNTSGHHTDWVLVKINGEEYKKWEYPKDKLPENQNFTLEFKVKAEADFEIRAEGHCNRHGSKSEEKVTVKVE